VSELETTTSNEWLTPPDGERRTFYGERFFSILHLAFVRDSFLMRKRFHWAAQLVLTSLIASLASCQSGGAGGNRTSNADVVDPNVSFSNPAKRNQGP
jgi:hypothetical protein